MAHVVVMYKTPKDTAAFDKYYFETHVPIAKKIPGLRKYEVSKGPVATPAGPSNSSELGPIASRVAPARSCATSLLNASSGCPDHDRNYPSLAQTRADN